MKKFVITKTPDEGYMRGEKMFFVGVEKQDPKSVARNTISYNAMAKKAKVFSTKKAAEEQLAKILKLMGDDGHLFRIEEICE